MPRERVFLMCSRDSIIWGTGFLWAKGNIIYDKLREFWEHIAGCVCKGSHWLLWKSSRERENSQWVRKAWQQPREKMAAVGALAGSGTWLRWVLNMMVVTAVMGNRHKWVTKCEIWEREIQDNYKISRFISWATGRMKSQCVKMGMRAEEEHLCEDESVWHEDGIDEYFWNVGERPRLQI